MHFKDTYTSSIFAAQLAGGGKDGSSSLKAAGKLTCQHKDLHRLRLARSAANVDRDCCRVEATAQMDNVSGGIDDTGRGEGRGETRGGEE